jgi:hypothetical protein
MSRSSGRWRSLVAHLHDTQGVTGSSPVRPTKFLGDILGDILGDKIGFQTRLSRFSLIREQLSEHFKVWVQVGEPKSTKSASRDGSWNQRSESDILGE